VRKDSPEADAWPRTLAEWRLLRPTKVDLAARREAVRAGARLVGEAPRAVAAVAGAAGGRAALAALGLSAAYLAVAGAVAYFGTKAIVDAASEGQTVPNIVSVVQAKANRELARQLGRRPTPAEVKDMHYRIARSIADQLRAATVPFGLGPVFRKVAEFFRGV